MTVTDNESVNRFFDKLDIERCNAYKEYWQSITPSDHEDCFRRWVFAFASVHTTWQANVRLYSVLESLDWVSRDVEHITGLIKSSRAGMHNQKARYLKQFSGAFFKNPDKFCSKPGRTGWTRRRNSLVKNIMGLGMAKTSFAFELMFPADCGVVCMDTHMLQLYGLSGSVSHSKTVYSAIERHWRSKAKAVGVSPTIARHVYWDMKMGKNDTRYWSSVFE